MKSKHSRRPSSFWTGARAAIQRPELWLIAAGGVLLTLLAWYWLEPLSGLLVQAAIIRDWILSFGPLAPLAYVLFFALQTVLAPLPGHFMGVMGGYLFGVVWGSLLSITGMTLGAFIAMGLARRFGRPLLERFFDPAQLKLWEGRLKMRSPLTWWLLFIFPVPDVVFYVAGLTTVPLRWLLLAVVAGRGIGLTLSNILGSLSATLPPEFVVMKWAILAILGALVVFYQRQIRLAVLLTARRLRRRLRHWTPSPPSASMPDDEELAAPLAVSDP